ncbi:AMP-ligase [Cupriavidus sp. TA19]|uniref:AMP-binding protein n=1 Tax=unclassified Cupriavidus TaxID=2640874 RepID=UPI00272946EE|nr:AMP-binding protein [Cupriavidus sp. TA19]GLC93436.1 AMP-ligase [Cupriavidus sp. TA19]
MTAIPLVAHTSPAAILAWVQGRPVTMGRFLADVAQLAAALPAGGHVFNACTDRYHFTVGLCAALLRGKATLLPSSQTPETVRQLSAFAPDVFCLQDQPAAPMAMPVFDYHEGLPVAAVSDADARADVPLIPADRVLAYVFTSGSTGTPVPHRKTWGAMARGARAAAQRLGLGDGREWTLVGTVPPQHMFGLEATVMLALQGGAALASAPAFYPADVRDALAAVPAPRALVSSPVHLRTLVQADMAMPAADLMLCATAPLGRELAAAAEALFHGPLREIYGSTETGQLATRRTAQEDIWTLVPGVRLLPRAADGGEDNMTWADGGHIEQPVPLGDAIEPLDAGHFLLHGRKGDLLNIAGKRTSLGYLDHQLNAIDGVQDGAFFMPGDSHEGDAQGHVVRLVAVVVAPGVASATILQALRERIDPAFLPRPLLFAERLPRNAAGKLPRDALAALVAQLCGARDGAPALPAFVIDAAHPAMAGHFPGNPIVPGVVLLDHALLALGSALGRPLVPTQAGTIKFLSPVRPGERVEIEHDTEPATDGSERLRLTLRSAGREVASGTLQLRGSTPEGAPC